MTGSIVNFEDVSDGPRTLDASGGDRDKEFQFTLPDDFIEDKSAILWFRIDEVGFNPAATQLSVFLNRRKVFDQIDLLGPGASGDLVFPHSIHEVLREQWLNQGTNILKFVMHSGKCTISDVVLWFRVSK